MRLGCAWSSISTSGRRVGGRSDLVRDLSRGARYVDALLPMMHVGIVLPIAGVLVGALGRATTYHPGDGHSSTVVGCPGAALRAYGTRRFAALVAAGVPLVAHRTLPCGTIVLLSGPGGSAVAWVGDRGPYGQDCPAPDGGQKRRVARRLGPGCVWRAEWDLTPGVAQRIGLAGRGTARRGPLRAHALR